MDVLMSRPSTEQRGRDIALLLNALEMANDQARYGELGFDFRNDPKVCPAGPQVDAMLAKLRDRAA